MTETSAHQHTAGRSGRTVLAAVVAIVLFWLTRFAAMVANLMASPGWFTGEPDAAWLGPVTVGIILGGWLYASMVVAWITHRPVRLGALVTAPPWGLLLVGATR